RPTRLEKTTAALVVIGALTGLWATAAGATWSIVATDPATGEVGAAIASCVPAEVLGDPERPLVPVVLVPGSTAAVTQAQLNLGAPDRIQELVAAGVGPSEIITDLVSEEFDELAALRQHAVASVAGDVAAFTGAETSDEALDAQGDGVSVQGNLLASRAVVGDALTAFEAERSKGLPLADALVAGLVAGSEAGGDRRCGDQSALFAQMAVAGPTDDPSRPTTLLTVVVDSDDGRNPVMLLEAAFVDGERGLIDAGAAETSAGSLVRTGVLVAALVMVVAGGLALWRGIGSVSARR
ncbi:MAG: DUF1028 domain-containing protein, partial [Acidimicrobiia bacterium]|nr:DUF1028 domain-containing protein [Acidimicrobiia bacterium]